MADTVTQVGVDSRPAATGRNLSDPPRYGGLRMSAEEYFAMPDDGHRYELIDGVVIVSPSPTPKHQFVMGEIYGQLHAFLRTHPVGRAYPETDVELHHDLVYRPEIVFLRNETADANRDRLRVAPDVVVEVISLLSRRYDAETKREDYERYGVSEYWLIDPDRGEMTFLRLDDGKYKEIAPEGDEFLSEAVPGFKLDLAALKKAFE